MADKEISLKKEASLLTISKMINLIITMLTSMLLSRFRSLEEYGTFSQLSLILSLLTTFSMLGIPNSINYFLPRIENDEEKQSFLNTFFGLNTLLSVIAGSLMVIVIPIMVWYFNNKNIYGFYYFAAIMPWAKITIQERGNLLIALHKTTKLIFYTFLNSVSLLVIIVFTHTIHQSFKFYMYMYVAIEVLFAFLVYFEGLNNSGRISLHIDKRLCKKVLLYTIPMGFSDMVNTISREIDKLMIGGFLDTEALAIYTNAAREISLTVISTSFIAVMMPKLSKMVKEKKIEEAVKLWKDTISFTYIFMAFGVTVLVVFAPQVITILYSEKYLPGVDVFRIYALILLWRTTYFGTMLNLYGETKKILVCSISAMGLNVIFNYIFYKLIGFTGPAWSTFWAIGIVNVLQLILSAKITQISILKLFPWLDLLKITFINATCGAIVYIMMERFNVGIDLRGCSVAVVIGIVWVTVYIGFIMKKRIKRQWEST